MPVILQFFINSNTLNKILSIIGGVYDKKAKK